MARKLARGAAARHDYEEREALVAWHRREEATRLAKLTERHPDGCPSEALAARWAPVAGCLRAICDTAEAEGRDAARLWVEAVHPHRFSTADGWVVACSPGNVGWMRERFLRWFEYAAKTHVRFVGCHQTNQRRAEQ
jgi:hypothetical protein